MINKSAEFSPSEIKKFYAEAFAALGKPETHDRIEIRYYPYVNINHTIRIRNQTVFVRISDLFCAVPEAVHKALAMILVAKLLNKSVPKSARAAYRDFVSDPEFQAIAVENKRRRGRKSVGPSKGDHFDLEHIFGKVNLIYFENRIPKPSLSWSRRNTFRRLGHYDSAHNLITVSRSLDDPSVPKHVVEYIVYHEMLHIKHPTRYRNGRRYNHTPEFRRDERKFMYFDEAEEWIDRNGKWLRRKAKRQ